MNVDAIKNIDNNHTPPLFEKTRKLYEKPELIPLDTVDIRTGSANVPENSNGLLES